MVNVTSDSIDPACQRLFTSERFGGGGGFTSGRFSATVGLANMGPSRCVRITALMKHTPFEFQVTIIFMLGRSPWIGGDFSGGSPPGMGLPPVVYI